MAPRAPDDRPNAPTTAVVQVAEDGTAKLYLGTELVEHTAGVNAAAVMRVLVDYAATIDTGIRVTTQMPNGTWTRHQLHPDGILTPLTRNLPAASSSASPVGSAEASRSQRQAWHRIRTRAAQGWLLVMLILLAAALVAVLATT